MKKKFAAAAAAVLALSMLGGCGNKKDAEPEKLAEVDTSSYVTLGEYNGMEVTVSPKEEVTDEDVLNNINTNLLKNYAEDVEVTDRAVQTGDTVHYSCVGTMDGEVFDGGSTAEGAEWSTVIGSQTMIDGFEDGFIGMMTGETKDIVCTFPDPYTMQPDYAGKEAVFTVTINSVTVTTYPELTSELLAEMESEYATPEEAMEAVRTNLEASAQAAFDSAAQNAVLSVVLTNCEFQDPPQFLLDECADTFRENLESQAAMYGMDIVTFVSQVNGISVTEEELEEQIQLAADAAAKQKIAIEAIADAEGLSEVTEEELQAEAEALLSQYTYYTTAEELLNDVDQDNFRDYIVGQRVLSWLVENNTIVY